MITPDAGAASARSTPPPTQDHDTRRAIDQVVTLACRAPSIHNTQPWSWCADDDVLELRADRTRLLRASDPLGRELVISCGAALHHARVAAAALGWTADVLRHPAQDDPDLLARFRLSPQERDPGALGDLEALRGRRTDRRSFSSWPVPSGKARSLARLAEAAGVSALVVDDPATQHRVHVLADRALGIGVADTARDVEQRRWIDRSRADGIPSTVVPAGPSSAGAPPNRFGPGLLEDRDREDEHAGTWIVLCSRRDDLPTWLRTGEGLSALWLRAQRIGLAVVPVSHVVEVDETRDELQEALGGLAVPQLLLHVGWQSGCRSPLPESPRRPLGDVLDVRSSPAPS